MSAKSELDCPAKSIRQLNSRTVLIRLRLPRPQFIFYVFSPKIACQAGKAI
jgi:hypothetical protein